MTVSANETAKATVTFGVHRFGGLVINGSDSNEVIEIAPANLAASGMVTPASDIDSTIVQPAASVLDAHGNLWVVSYPGSRIAMFTPQQRASASGPVAPTVVISGIERPWGITVDGRGTVWVAHTVLSMRPSVGQHDCWLHGRPGRDERQSDTSNSAVGHNGCPTVSQHSVRSRVPMVPETCGSRTILEWLTSFRLPSYRRADR